ncbi:hypothetical protein [Dactylosporangium sp. CS-033363]|uniref:hypothetical protein n=1 Tax=Dactylosporangium sp. CS-033363 TaxID=3239935 RepID=UPI003D8B5572
MQHQKDWHVRVDYRGTPAPDQLFALAAHPDRVFSVNSTDGIVRITYHVRAAESAIHAMMIFTNTIGSGILGDLIGDGVLDPAHRILIVDPDDDHQPDPGALIGAAEFARRLNLTVTRLNALRDEEFHFPRSIQVPGLGAAYRAGDVTEYIATRLPGNPGGRPRANDEQRLRDAIAAVVEHGDPAARWADQFDDALDTPGRLRGKAYLLHLMTPAERDRVAAALDASAAEDFRGTLDRAAEMLGADEPGRLRVGDRVRIIGTQTDGRIVQLDPGASIAKVQWLGVDEPTNAPVISLRRVP